MIWPLSWRVNRTVGACRRAAEKQFPCGLAFLNDLQFSFRRPASPPDVIDYERS